MVSCSGVNTLLLIFTCSIESSDCFSFAIFIIVNYAMDSMGFVVVLQLLMLSLQSFMVLTVMWHCLSSQTTTTSSSSFAKGPG